uniref:Uncharacterized protein n=1 Tax=Lepeophtheirus salmonis TaxID=72036 RepID=A0A0K2V0V0_LEPSM
MKSSSSFIRLNMKQKRGRLKPNHFHESYSLRIRTRRLIVFSYNGERIDL